jgi:hypothetical protein
MKSLPSGLQVLLDHEPRLLEADQAPRWIKGREETWWVGLVDTTNCYDPDEIALSLREKGLSEAVGSQDTVWLRPIQPEEKQA